MNDRHKSKPFPFRMQEETRAEAQELAKCQDRSLNWQLNELVKIGLTQLREQKKSAETGGAVAALV